MAVDCAHELRKHKVAMLSLWPGSVKTEFITEYLAEASEKAAEDNAAAKRVSIIWCIKSDLVLCY